MGEDRGGGFSAFRGAHADLLEVPLQDGEELLEAAGGVTLERCGAILDERVAEVRAEGSGGAAAG